MEVNWNGQAFVPADVNWISYRTGRLSYRAGRLLYLLHRISYRKGRLLYQRRLIGTGRLLYQSGQDENQQKL